MCLKGSKLIRLPTFNYLQLPIDLLVDQDFLTKYDIKANNAILVADKHLPMYDGMSSCEADTKKKSI
ncbi:hypothetical protein L1987_20349 [Smallanthus sonchifolius]|uniref:Uncharacterized protein n=1 Tax=Smallanthus sonchifolius TaxID=185202 RepID=A0ACB9IRK5_9ASTR|nr:hypothetical protein L1987_20349 [Smallanthus sonchifolius]